MRAALVALALASFAACSPYAPNLGNEPFLCGSADPKCPDGYTCEANGTQMVCVSGKATTDGGLNGMCANDSALEGSGRNDTTATAFQTPVAMQQKSITYSGLAICPAGDVDNYAINLTEVQSIDVTVVYETWGGPLTGGILNSTGTSVLSLSPETGMQDTVHGNVQNMPAGTYYVQVVAQSSAMPENNYKLTITVAP
ncbi:MAG TPA: hypothetical protein VLX92_01760 [Kofleriaceae bacterium]|nr:hypothetical protein [Kofleriaceae bacterium]